MCDFGPNAGVTFWAGYFKVRGIPFYINAPVLGVAIAFFHLPKSKVHVKTANMEHIASMQSLDVAEFD